MSQELFKDKYRVKSTRLRDFNYVSNGAYYVTICTKNRQHFFGEIVNGKMKLSEIGQIVCDEWIKTKQIRKNIELDEWVVMPNHFHGILVIDNSNVETCRGMSLRTHNKFSKPISQSLSMIINHFKSSVKRWCNKNGYQYFCWQPNFYEHIIRNEKELYRIRNYIKNNLIQWKFDNENKMI